MVLFREVRERGYTGSIMILREYVLLGCLQEAFERIGIPAELLMDNMKQMVDRRSAEGI
jgi:transposase